MGSDSSAAAAPTAPAAANAQPGPAPSTMSPANGAPSVLPTVSAEPNRPIASPREGAGTSRLSVSLQALSVGAQSSPEGIRARQRIRQSPASPTGMVSSPIAATIASGGGERR